MKYVVKLKVYENIYKCILNPYSYKYEYYEVVCGTARYLKTINLSFEMPRELEIGNKILIQEQSFTIVDKIFLEEEIHFYVEGVRRRCLNTENTKRSKEEAQKECVERNTMTYEEWKQKEFSVSKKNFDTPKKNKTLLDKIKGLL